ncbi:MAG: four helix bundle protein [Bacteroidales bacterium]|nr:four helix bundle protein [Bacteroidales bacterium]
MPTIKEILQVERNCGNGWVVLFLEGKFWKAYERSAYMLTCRYNFKPSKRFVKLVGEEVISVGFPSEQLAKYLAGAALEAGGKRCRAFLPLSFDELAFKEWKSTTRIKEPKPKTPVVLEIPDEWKPQTQVFHEENLPVFKMVYDLLLRLFHETQKMGKDYRYTLGEDLKRYLLRVEVCIYHANMEKEARRKVDFIAEALERMLEVKLCVRILHDSKQLSLKKYALLCEQMVAVEKNLSDWERYNQNSILHDIDRW